MLLKIGQNQSQLFCLLVLPIPIMYKNFKEFEALLGS